MYKIRILKFSLTAQWLLLTFSIASITFMLLLEYFTTMNISEKVGLSLRLSTRFILAYIPLTFLYFKTLRSERNLSLGNLLVLNVILLAILIDGIGNAFGMYERQFLGIYFDKYVHFLIPFVLSVGLAYYHTEKNSDLEHKFLWLIYSFLIMCIASCLFEIYESLSDQFFGTNMVNSYSDTLYDIILDFFGIISGSLIVLFIVFSDRHKYNSSNINPTDENLYQLE